MDEIKQTHRLQSDPSIESTIVFKDDSLTIKYTKAGNDIAIIDCPKSGIVSVKYFGFPDNP